MSFPAHSLVIDGDDTPISPSATSIQNGWFNANYQLTLEQLNAITKAESVGVMVRPTYNAPIFLGFDDMPLKNGAQLFGALLRKCGHSG